MQRIAVELKLDPLDVIRRNLVPTGAFPYRTASGGLLDSGDYPAAVEKAVQDGGLAELKARQATGARRGQALRHRAHRRGRAERLQHGLHHRGADARGAPQGRTEERRAGDRDDVGRSVRRGLGACRLGAAGPGPSHRGGAGRRRCARASSRTTSAWSARWTPRAMPGRSRRATTPAGSPPRSCGAVHLAAMQLKEKLARSAAAQLNVPADEIEFAGGKIGAQGQSRQRRAVRPPRGGEPLGARRGAGRRAGAARDRVLDAAAAHRARRRRRDQLVALPRLHLRLLRRRDRPRHRRGADRQVRHHARLRHACCIPAWWPGRSPAASRMRSAPRCTRSSSIRDDGAFLSGTFADYLVPTTTEVPEPVILHVETPSPFTPLGAKGVGEGNCM